MELDSDDNNDIYDDLRVDYFSGVHNSMVNMKSGEYQTNFNMLYLNIQSLRNKLYNLESLIKTYECDIHIIVLTEIWINEQENQFFNMEGYKSYFSNRVKSYGGVAIYVRENIASNLILKLEFEKSNFLGIYLIEQKIHIFGIYRSHETNINSFLEKMDEISNKYKHSMIFGDFNINLLNKNNQEVMSYVNVLMSNGFIIYNKVTNDFATRIGNTSQTIIDHFITDIVKYKYDFHIISTSLSDHKMFFISSKFKPIEEQINKFMTILKYEELAADSTWNKLDSIENFDNLVYELSSLVSKYTRIVPKKRSKEKNDWMTDEIRNAIKIRDSFFKYRKKYPNDEHVNRLFKLHKNKVNRLIAQSKKNFFSKEIERNPTNSKKLWDIYKRAIFNKKNDRSNTHIKGLEINGNVVTKKEEISELMNEFFINVTREINVDNGPIDYEYLNSFRQNTNFLFDLTPTNSEEISNAINKLKTAAATGFDNISMKFIKKFKERLIPLLVKFINTSFLSSTFPSSLKIAIVTPIFKTGNAKDKTNYRPISVLSAFSKIFEFIIKNRLDNFLVNNQIFHDEQYGFEKNSNTTAACLSLTDFVTKNMDEKLYVGCLFLDLQKAFDCVDYEILQFKLNKLNFNSPQLNFFDSYLTNRKQRVKIGDTLSESKTIVKGVPQGSILGPLLFKIYIDDIARLKLKGLIQLYADDAVLKYAERDEESLKASIMHDLPIIEEWLKKNRLLLNVKKTKILLFENRQCTYPNFSYNGTIIEVVKSFNYLGLQIDSRLKWQDHINHVIKKITPYIFILRRLRNIFNKPVLKIIYSSYILSNIMYLNPIWSNTCQIHLGKLDIVHKKAIKAIHNYPIRISTNNLYSSQYLSLANISKLELYTIAFKIIHNEIKHNFILNRSFEIHNYNTRNKSNFYLTLFRTDRQKNNCLYNSLKLYNELPNEIKEIANYYIYKKKIKELILN